jgi:hypothetical protein
MDKDENIPKTGEGIIEKVRWYLISTQKWGKKNIVKI